jgi:hypothetical protein
VEWGVLEGASGQERLVQKVDLLGDVASALHRHEFLGSHGLSYKPYLQLPDLAGALDETAQSDLATLDESHQDAATSWSLVGIT